MTQTKTAEGCCSAISPCSHQQRDPTTICDVCNRAAPTQETTPAFRLDECVALIQAYEKTLADRVVAYSSSAPMPRRDADCRLDDARRRLADAARGAIPQLIAEVRERDAQLLDRDAFSQEYFDRATAAEADAAAARKRVRELEERLTDVTAALVAATSLLSRSPKTAAPSDKMFDQMLIDYAGAVDRARADLGRAET